MTPVMKLWIWQWIVIVPAFVNVIGFDPLENTVVSKLPSSAVSEWFVPSSFVTCTV